MYRICHAISQRRPSHETVVATPSLFLRYPLPSCLRLQSPCWPHNVENVRSRWPTLLSLCFCFCFLCCLFSRGCSARGGTQGRFVCLPETYQNNWQQRQFREIAKYFQAHWIESQIIASQFNCNKSSNRTGTTNTNKSFQFVAFHFWGSNDDFCVPESGKNS